MSGSSRSIARGDQAAGLVLAVLPMAAAVESSRHKFWRQGHCATLAVRSPKQGPRRAQTACILFGSGNATRHTLRVPSTHRTVRKAVRLLRVRGSPY
eukprot:scaffold98644_cov28-Tisochrysis_lutea.AAC.6